MGCNFFSSTGVFSLAVAASLELLTPSTGLAQKVVKVETNSEGTLRVTFDMPVDHCARFAGDTTTPLHVLSMGNASQVPSQRMMNVALAALLSDSDVQTDSTPSSGVSKLCVLTKLSIVRTR